jgi:hypothetical protein
LDASASGRPLGLEDRASFTRTLETTADELTRGTTFAGRYEIIEELGAGFDFSIAAILGLTGDGQDREEAFRHLELSTSEFHPWSAIYGTEPFLDPLRSDPRFAQIIKKVGFPIE